MHEINSVIENMHLGNLVVLFQNVFFHKYFKKFQKDFEIDCRNFLK